MGKAVRAFLRIFNWTHVALVFWTCFGLGLSHTAAMAPTLHGDSWVYTSAFLTRQYLVTGLPAN